MHNLKFNAPRLLEELFPVDARWRPGVGPILRVLRRHRHGVLCGIGRLRRCGAIQGPTRCARVCRGSGWCHACGAIQAVWAAPGLTLIDSCQRCFWEGETKCAATGVRSGPGPQLRSSVPQSSWHWFTALLSHPQSRGCVRACH
jgi:hypothetical protein